MPEVSALGRDRPRETAAILVHAYDEVVITWPRRWIFGILAALAAFSGAVLVSIAWTAVSDQNFDWSQSLTTTLGFALWLWPLTLSVFAAHVLIAAVMTAPFRTRHRIAAATASLVAFVVTAALLLAPTFALQLFGAVQVTVFPGSAEQAVADTAEALIVVALTGLWCVLTGMLLSPLLIRRVS